MTEKPYTDADVEAIARAEYEHDMAATGLGRACRTSWDAAPWGVRNGYRDRARVGLDALTADGWQQPSTPTPEQPAVVSVDRADLMTALSQVVPHSHERPGVWDADGRPCVECAARARLTAALTAGERVGG
ncbi:hypothetical protein C1I95_24675 [Micromonospora craterilacus]|uniref:Uncharacterized protein n=1 Tax=Micromonospora craterilacus TaxID=1655439 RepID=A0A2W2FBN8_9ACTN|nr:hypothetical protein [Micromonospora craterilacus]PZG12944.1 hypothetical protein C1I95_24675 [Micromonospora craterilacus]